VRRQTSRRLDVYWIEFLLLVGLALVALWRALA
jgi:hypothetical protein